MNLGNLSSVLLASVWISTSAWSVPVGTAFDNRGKLNTHGGEGGQRPA